MSDPRGFLKFSRAELPMRPLEERVRDFAEAYVPLTDEQVRQQSQRCMNCGVPFCHEGCPLGNPIPEFNDLVQQGRWKEAYEELSRTNPFPEFTGKVCPAPCEDACVLTVTDKPVTIKNVELAVIERGFEEGWVVPCPANPDSGRKVAVVGSGPAGLACAHALRQAGHAVTVFERSDRAGGLLRYGVPDYKMAKAMVDRRLAVLEKAGVKFELGREVGKDVSLAQLREGHHAVAVCVGALKARDLTIPGRELAGVHLAMDYLTAQNKACSGDALPAAFDAKGKHVVILGGGDTGADCFGTAIRQGARSVTQLNHYQESGRFKHGSTWPLHDPHKHAFVYDEDGQREWGVQAVAFKGGTEVLGVEVYKVWMEGRLRVPVPNTLKTIPAEMVLLAIGFDGAELAVLALGADGHVLRTGRDYQTSHQGVFAAGDARRGASLIVWAIAEGLNCAASIDRFLTGHDRLHHAFAKTGWAGLGRKPGAVTTTPEG